MPREGLQINDLTSGIGWSDAANLLRGTIDPRGVLTAARGSLYIRDDPAGPAQVWINTTGLNLWAEVLTSGGTQPSNLVFVSSLADLPAPVGGVIQLAEGTAYFFTALVDLLGARLVAASNNALLGSSSEIARITSTGLPPGSPLLTSRRTLTIQNLTFQDVDTAVDIDDDGGAGAPLALDWEYVNFQDIPNIETIGSADNFIFSTGAFLGSQGLRFNGSIGTIAINNSLLRGSGAAGAIIHLDAGTTVTRRFRVIYSSLIAPGASTAISVDPLTTIPGEGFILDTVNFSGGGVYLGGVASGTKTLFVNCTGIENTSVNGMMFAQDNAVQTPIADTASFVKVVAATNAAATNEKYQHTDNRLTNDSVVRRKYRVSGSVDFTTGANNVVAVGVYDSVLGAVRPDSISRSTANTGGGLKASASRLSLATVSGTISRSGSGTPRPRTTSRSRT